MITVAFTGEFSTISIDLYSHLVDLRTAIDNELDLNLATVLGRNLLNIDVRLRHINHGEG